MLRAACKVMLLRCYCLSYHFSAFPPAYFCQVCLDAGLHPVYVYRGGTYGWRLDDSTKAYSGYQLVREKHTHACCL